MRLKVLGAYGASDATHNLTGYVIDDRIAVDAGTLTSKLSLLQQARIEVVFITHAHADHTRDLPHLIHNRFNQDAPPLTIVASTKVMEQLSNHVFNGQVWPDFGKLVSPLTGKPAINYRPLQPGKRTVIQGAGFTAVTVDHSVDAAGVILDLNDQTIVFTGDTGPTKEIWKRANKATNVVTIVTEASFPNDYQQLADDSGHLSPQTFAVELGKIELDIPVYASHRKLPWEHKIESEMRNIRDRRARILVEKQYTF
ncbi:MAG TPA: 3',5'-cyclic-nucleotide phosphodiesterase [Thermoanaerobaculia bacterium]|nr:3',5'-cyclic-nucleotide phosphodiesterase [Thermoanaerobaculia bacterium]